jgi:hypothetical protein
MIMEPPARNSMPLTKFAYRLNTLYAALCLVMLLFLGFALWYRPRPVYVFPSGPDVLLYVVPVLGILGYFFGGYAFRLLLDPLEAGDPAARKFARYQSASLIRYGCLEIPALIALFAYMKQGYFFYLLIGMLLIAHQISIWPSRKRIEGQLPPPFKGNGL